jgi:hypothetical protein
VIRLGSEKDINARLLGNLEVNCKLTLFVLRKSKPLPPNPLHWSMYLVVGAVADCSGTEDRQNFLTMIARGYN